MNEGQTPIDGQVALLSMCLAVESLSELEDSEGFPRVSDSLGLFSTGCLVESGLEDIWDIDFDEAGCTYSVAIDASSSVPYLWALNGYLCGDTALAAFETEVVVGPGSGNWDATKAKLKSSQRLSFRTPFHVYADAVQHTFFLEWIFFQGCSFALDQKNLVSLLDRIGQTPPSDATDLREFLDYFGPEISSLDHLPKHIVSFMFSELLIGTNWNLFEAIINEWPVSALFASEFNWVVPDDVPWVLSVWRQSQARLQFRPWPWQRNSTGPHGDREGQPFGQSDVSRTQSSEPVNRLEKLATLATVYLLWGDEDFVLDLELSGVEALRENLRPELRAFIEAHRTTLETCYSIMPTEWSDNECTALPYLSEMGQLTLEAAHEIDAAWQDLLPIALEEPEANEIST